MKATLHFTFSGCTTLGNQHMASACVTSESHRYKLASDRTRGMGSSLRINHFPLPTSGFNSQTNVYSKHHLKPEVWFFKKPHPPNRILFVSPGFCELLRWPQTKTNMKVTGGNTSAKSTTTVCVSPRPLLSFKLWIFFKYLLPVTVCQASTSVGKDGIAYVLEITEWHKLNDISRGNLSSGR